DVGSSRKPSQGARPVLRRDRVTDIGLKNAGGAAPEPLNDPAEKQQPDGVGKTEYKKSRRRRGQPDQQSRPAAVTVGDAAPQGRGNQLGDEKGGNDGADRHIRSMELQT